MERIKVDFTHLEGTNCYCSPESAAIIRQDFGRQELRAFHQIGTGDYHYLTLFWLELIREPFCLVLFDHHPDDQPAAFGDALGSCGGWVTDARRLPLLRQDVWIRDAADFPCWRSSRTCRSTCPWTWTSSPPTSPGPTGTRARCPRTKCPPPCASCARSGGSSGSTCAEATPLKKEPPRRILP